MLASTARTATLHPMASREARAHPYGVSRRDTWPSTARHSSPRLVQGMMTQPSDRGMYRTPNQGRTAIIMIRCGRRRSRLARRTSRSLLIMNGEKVSLFFSCSLLKPCPRSCVPPFLGPVLWPRSLAPFPDPPSFPDPHLVAAHAGTQIEPAKALLSIHSFFFAHAGTQIEPAKPFSLYILFFCACRHTD